MEWKKHIEETYGSVVLEAKSNAPFSFSSLDANSDSLLAKSIEYASKKLKKDRYFAGMLPRGRYTFVDEIFEVEPGLEIVRKLDTRLRKNGVQEALRTKEDYTGDGE